MGFFHSIEDKIIFGKVLLVVVTQGLLLSVVINQKVKCSSEQDDERAQVCRFRGGSMQMFSTSTLTASSVVTLQQKIFRNA